jgi:transcription elongation factor Elf1
MKISGITNIQVVDFINDYIDRSELILLETSEEVSELIAIANARGIILKNNRALGGFKTVYTFTDVANRNGARLPKDILLKILPGIVGTPVNINHNRKYVVAHYIDYRYIEKENKVVAFGVFYKDNFKEEWKEAQKLFKEGKLTTSHEIYYPEDKKVYLNDGTYMYTEMEMAGGALLYTKKPGHEKAVVLEMAMANIQEEESIPEKSNYHCKNLIDERGEGKCTKCGLCLSEEIVQPTVQPTPVIPRIKCSNCQKEFDINGTDVLIKCPGCFALVNRQGQMQYPPQIKNFQITCVHCSSSNWLITSMNDNTAKIKCQTCSKEYDVEFSSEDSNKIRQTMAVLFVDRTPCPQCRKTIIVSGSSKMGDRELTCGSCGLKFPYKQKDSEKYKSIKSIKEVVAQSSTFLKESDLIRFAKSALEEGGKQMDGFELTKFHRYVTDEGLVSVEQSALNTYDENIKIDVSKVLTTEQRNALGDEDYAVVVRTKNKVTGKPRKIRMFPINDEAHVRNALARLAQEEPQVTLKEWGVSIESVKSKILRRAKQLGMNDLLETHKETSSTKVSIEQSELDNYTNTIKTLTEENTVLKNENAELKKKTKLSERKIELSSFAEGKTDEDLLDDAKYEQIKLEKATKETTTLEVSVSDAVTDVREGIDTSANKTLAEQIQATPVYIKE